MAEAVKAAASPLVKLQEPSWDHNHQQASTTGLDDPYANSVRISVISGENVDRNMTKITAWEKDDWDSRNK
jgi:hypothetical protein